MLGAEVDLLDVAECAGRKGPVVALLVEDSSDVLDNGASQRAMEMHSRMGSQVDGAHDSGDAGKCKT